MEKIFDLISKENSVKVRASNDNTGNLSSGGDWILESTGEDISTLYFNSEIQHWNYLLGLLPTLSTNGSVFALAYDTIGNGVYVGGTFTKVDVCGTNISVNRVARYDFTDLSWSVLGYNSDVSKNGVAGVLNGGSTEVRSLFVDASGLVYVGGVFSTLYDNVNNTAKSATNIARYDPNTKTWTGFTGLVSAGGTGSTGGTVRSIVVKNSNKYIFAGGDFGDNGTGTNLKVNYMAYIADASSVCRSVGFDWGSGAASAKPGPVYRLRLDPSENYLYAGGTFGTVVNGTGATNYNGIVKWDITTNAAPKLLTTTFGSGVDVASGKGINAMKYYKDASSNEYLYIGGNFTTVGGATSKAPFARYNLTSSGWDISFSSTNWVTNTAMVINTIEFDLCGNPYFGGKNMTSVAGYDGVAKSGSQFFRLTFDQDASGNYKIKDGSGTFYGLGSGLTSTGASLEALLRTGTNFLLGGTFTMIDSNLNAGNLAYYTYDNSENTTVAAFDSNYSGNPAFDTLDTLGPNTVNLKQYLQNNLPNVARGKEVKFQSYIKGKAAVFTDRFADISGWYLTRYGGNAYGFYTNKLASKDISGISIRYTIPDSGYNGNNGKYDCGDISAANMRLVYIPATIPETYTLRIKNQDYVAFNFQPPGSNPNINYNLPNGASRTATIGTVMPLVFANYDNSQVLWLDSMKVIGWGSNLLEYGSGNFLNCLTEDTGVLTPNGYVNVKLLIDGSEILDENGKVHKIKKIQTSFVRGNKKTFPYIIKKNSIGPNYPSEDVRISGAHLIKFNDKWVCPCKCSCFEQDKSEDFITYYHIELENYETNLVISGGLVVESLTHIGDAGEKIRIERYKNQYIPPKRDIKLDK